MSFNFDTIETKLNCLSCGQRFVNPRILPCGETLCEKCVSKMKKCFFCNEKHKAPSKGFPLNKVFNDLLGPLSLSITKENLYDKVTCMVNTFESKMLNFKEDFQNVDQVFDLHCETITNNIDIYCDSIIEQVKKHRIELLNKMANYKIECLKKRNYGLISNFIETSFDKIERAKQDLESSKECDERVLKKIESNFSQALKHFGYYVLVLRAETYGGLTTTFIQEDFNQYLEKLLNLKICKIGEPLDLDSLVKRDKFKSHQMLHINEFYYSGMLFCKIQNLTETELIMISGFLNSGGIFFTISIYKIDENKKLEFIDKTRIAGEFISHYVYDSKIYTLHMSKTFYGNNLSEEYVLIIHSCDLEKVLVFELPYQPSDILVNSKFILVYSVDDEFFYKYDLCFNKIENFGQSTNENDDYYVYDIIPCNLTEEKLIFYKNYSNFTELISMSLKSGKTECLFKTDFEFYKLLSDRFGRLYIMDKSNIITVYLPSFQDSEIFNNEPSYVKKLNIEDNTNILSFCLTHDGDLLIVTISKESFKVIFV